MNECKVYNANLKKCLKNKLKNSKNQSLEKKCALLNINIFAFKSIYEYEYELFSLLHLYSIVLF